MGRTKSTACRTTDDDIACCMDNVDLVDVVPATCTSLRCLAHDLSVASDMQDARTALGKNDRCLYLLMAVTATLLLLVWLRASPTRGGVVCTCGRS